MECCYPADCGEYTVTPMLVSPNYCRKYCEPEPACCPRLPRCQKPKYYCCDQRPQRRAYDCCDPPPQKGCCSPTLRRVPCASQPPCESCCYQPPPCKPVKTKYIMPCYRYEDGRIVRRFPVSAFKRNGMQDVEHSTQGTANFLVRHHRDVSVECEVCLSRPVKVVDPAKVPPYCPKHALGSHPKKPIEANQPTVLMRRACEVACGTRKRKPFVVSSFAADPHNEIRRFHAEDERGNCCFHFERKKPPNCEPCWSPACQPCNPYQPRCLECQYVDGVYTHPEDPISNPHY